jgi:hypothetical protein
MLQQRVRLFIPHASGDITHPVVELYQTLRGVQPQKAVSSSEPDRLFRSPWQKRQQAVRVELRLTLLVMVVFHSGGCYIKYET